MRGRGKGICTVGLAVVLGASCWSCASSGSAQAQAEGSPSQAAAAESANDASASAKEAAAAEAASTVGGRYVSVAWLKEHAGDVVVVDARSASDYDTQHIPGSVNLHWTSLSDASVSQGEAGWAELPDAAELAAAVSALGIDNTLPVVVYTDSLDGWGEDGRILWTLRKAGVEDVYILDGGWTKWLFEQGTHVPGVEAEDLDPISQVVTASGKEHAATATLVDARGADEFAGETTMGEARAGHIPGAVSVPSVDLYNEDATLKSEDELRSLFADAGLSEGDEIIVYCTGGVRAANVAEVLTALGYQNVSVYTAGFSEWAGDEANEVA